MSPTELPGIGDSIHLQNTSLTDEKPMNVPDLLPESFAGFELIFDQLVELQGYIHSQ